MGGVGDNTIAHWCAELAEHDQQISDLQEAKRDLFKAIRDEHGKVLADAVKGALRLSRMTPEQLDRRVETDAETDRILRIIERGTSIATHVARGASDHEHEPASAADRDAGGGEDAPVSCVDNNPIRLDDPADAVVGGTQPADDRRNSETLAGEIGASPITAPRQATGNAGASAGRLHSDHEVPAESPASVPVVAGGVHIPHHGVVRA